MCGLYFIPISNRSHGDEISLHSGKKLFSPVGMGFLPSHPKKLFPTRLDKTGQLAK
jgi:hypothetical protein